MINENQEYKHSNYNLANILIGILIGGLTSGLTVLLFTPNSGKKTRNEIKNKGVELLDRTTEFVNDFIGQVSSKLNNLTSNASEKIKEIKKHGKKLAIEQLDHVTDAANAGKKAVRKA